MTFLMPYTLPSKSRTIQVNFGFQLKTLCCLIWLLTCSVLNAQTSSTELTFNSGNGALPLATLLQSNNGNFFYGTTSEGGTGSCSNLLNIAVGCGTVFSWLPTGTLTTLVNFNDSNGSRPSAELVQDQFGSLYGTTSEGGSGGAGTVFKITLKGIFTTLVNFSTTNGSKPVSGLVQDAYGNFYGTTYEGGLAGYGTIFKVTSSGALTTLVHFTGPNGANPFSKLVLATDGNLYGTTFYGGSGLCQNFGQPDGCGTIFKVTPSGVLTTLVNFDTSTGAYPRSGFLLGLDGNFYGTTFSGGGQSGNGTVFQMTPAGILSTLLIFNGSNGNNPTSFILGIDGSYYGVTFSGGDFGSGVLFRLAPDGTYTPIINFDGTNGSWPIGITQGNNGIFYGTSTGGGTSGKGIIFSVAGALTTAPTLTSFSPRQGAPDTAIILTGTNLSSVQGVMFNGIAASFTINSDNQLTAIVPRGASTGTIAVTNPSGTSVSSQSFTVLPPAPTLTSFSPSSGAVGTTITLTGTNFVGTTAVTLAGINTTFTVLSDTQMTVVVPADASSGIIKVTTPGGSATSTNRFTLVLAPTISSFTPLSAAVGATVTISGTNLDSTTGVTFGGVAAAIISTAPSTVKATVPIAAVTGNIGITNPAGIVTSQGIFAVALPPTLTSFSPSSGAIGITITLTGTNFMGTTAVTLAGNNMTFTILSSTQITVTVPSSASSGTIRVTTPGGNVVSTIRFTLTP